MKKQIQDYTKMIDEKLNSHKEQDWDEIISIHLKQIEFFGHERLVHLIVTMTVAVLVMLSVILFFISDSTISLALVFLLIGLLIPYIMHYYLLENEVQKMYTQYNRMIEKKKFNK